MQLDKPEFQPPDGCTIEFGGESSSEPRHLGQLLGNVTILAAGIVFVLVFSLKSFRAMGIFLAIGILSMGTGGCRVSGRHGFAFWIYGDRWRYGDDRDRHQ